MRSTTITLTMCPLHLNIHHSWILLILTKHGEKGRIPLKKNMAMQLMLPARSFVMLTAKAPCKPMSWQALSAHSIKTMAVATVFSLEPTKAHCSSMTRSYCHSRKSPQCHITPFMGVNRFDCWTIDYVKLGHGPKESW